MSETLPYSAGVDTVSLIFTGKGKKMENLPGSKFAKEHGYELHSYSGNKNSATYIKRWGDTSLHLTCRDDQSAEIERILGMVSCRIGSFSYPNKNFKIFESQLLCLVQKESLH